MHAPLEPRDIATALFERSNVPGVIESYGDWEEQMELGGEYRLLKVVILYQGEKQVRALFAVDFNCLGAAQKSGYEFPKNPED